MKKIPDGIIYDSPGYKPGMKEPVIVVLVGEGGDLFELAAIDVGDPDTALEAVMNLPERIIQSLQEDPYGDD